MTVDDYLISRGFSRRLIIQLKKDPAFLTLDRLPVRTIDRLSSGSVLRTVLPPEESSERMVPVSMDLDIIYEDEDLLIVNKAADVPIHPSNGNFSNTLANGLAWHFAQKGESFVFRVINRLDRDTTGLLIVAKHALAACILSGMVSRQQIHRTYLAAVEGNLSTGFLPLSAAITIPIARVPGSVIERQTDWVRGEPACTHYSFLSYNPRTDTSLVELRLKTGRTHQIRVHMKYLGYPLPGDFLYNPDYRYIGRQSLHSWKLAFSHPITKEPLAFTAAVPNDMTVFFC